MAIVPSDERRFTKEPFYFAPDELQIAFKHGMEAAIYFQRYGTLPPSRKQSKIAAHPRNVPALPQKQVTAYRKRLVIHSIKARAYGCVNDLTWWQLHDLIEKSGGKCARCGCERPLTIDHIEPMSKGGAHSVGNIQMLCRPCNSSKYVGTANYGAEESRGQKSR